MEKLATISFIKDFLKIFFKYKKNCLLSPLVHTPAAVVYNNYNDYDRFWTIFLPK
jgi:hypothetical protein